MVTKLRQNKPYGMRLPDKKFAIVMYSNGTLNVALQESGKEPKLAYL